MFIGIYFINYIRLDQILRSDIPLQLNIPFPQLHIQTPQLSQPLLQRLLRPHRLRLPSLKFFLLPTLQLNIQLDMLQFPFFLKQNILFQTFLRKYLITIPIPPPAIPSQLALTTLPILLHRLCPIETFQQAPHPLFAPCKFFTRQI
jgi:hypothetical protein